jgi:hypothetical protein
VGIDEDGAFGLSKHIDEAGGDDETGGVDGLFRGGGVQMADGDDAAVADGDIGGVPGGAGAVDDMTVTDEDVEGLGGEDDR